jgi:hypothetical protein
MGAVSFGFWWNSFAAALFGGFALCFLAGIYRAVEKMAAGTNTGRRDDAAAIFEPRTLSAHQPSTDIQLKAIQRLRPWVDDEISLTEEGAKAYCTVLLDLVAGGNGKLEMAPGSRGAREQI